MNPELPEVLAGVEREAVQGAERLEIDSPCFAWLEGVPGDWPDARFDDFKTNPTPFKVVSVAQEQLPVDDLHLDLDVWNHSNARSSGSQERCDNDADQAQRTALPNHAMIRRTISAAAPPAVLKAASTGS
ncbi:MAG: hypothetical protein K1Y01_17585 [Vicinamibacteria bacterium]|nr:hypothetical protein [Vicinamibacteria bacterium]